MKESEDEKNEKPKIVKYLDYVPEGDMCIFITQVITSIIRLYF